MFVILLKFSDNKSDAPKFMEAHKAWIDQGLSDGVFLVVGSLKPNAGGAILAHGCCEDEIRRRVDQDPFVAENVVRAEILEIEPNRTDKRFGFLIN